MNVSTITPEEHERLSRLIVLAVHAVSLVGAVFTPCDPPGSAGSQAIVLLVKNFRALYPESVAQGLEDVRQAAAVLGLDLQTYDSTPSLVAVADSKYGPN